MTGIDGDGDQIRAVLRTAGAVLGTQVTVVAGTGWSVTDEGIEVGADWYAVRGHSTREVAPLALLQIWEGPREFAAAPIRARRRASLARRHPHFEPLLALIARVQAVLELLRAMPGLRGDLFTALRRTLPDDTATLPRHLQWLALLLARVITDTPDHHDADLAPEVQAEWQRLETLAADLGGGPRAALLRVLAPDPERPPLRRFERAYALLQPPYLRLLARDLVDRGIADDSNVGGGDPSEGIGDDSIAPSPETAEGSETTEGTEGADSGGQDSGGQDSGGQDSASQDSAGQDSADQEPDGQDADQARPGSGRDVAEGADLFAAEQAAFAARVLATPLPTEGDLRAALIDLAADARADAHSRDPGRDDELAVAGEGTGSRAGGSALADYRSRVVQLGPAIERVREIWERVIVDRLSARSALSRRSLPDGDDLASEALATAVIEVRSGVPRPRVFRGRESRTREAPSVGSTDYVLLIDRSASMQGPVAEAAADVALIMLEGLAGVGRDVANAERTARTDLDLDIRTALIVFDAEAHLVKAISSGLDDATRRSLHSAIRSPRGSTNDGAALRLAAEQLGVSGAQHRAWGAPDGTRRRRIVILVSDGGSNDPVAAGQELRRLRAAQVAVHGVGIGADDVVHRYAPDGHRVDDPRLLATALESIVRDELP